MPSEFVANCLVFYAIVAIVDSEMERDSGIATLGIGFNESGECCGCSVCVAVPVVRIACRLIVDARITVSDGEMEGNDRVATLVIGFNESRK